MCFFACMCPRASCYSWPLTFLLGARPTLSWKFLPFNVSKQVKQAFPSTNSSPSGLCKRKVQSTLAYVSSSTVTTRDGPGDRLQPVNIPPPGHKCSPGNARLLECTRLLVAAKAPGFAALAYLLGLRKRPRTGAHEVGNDKGVVKGRRTVCKTVHQQLYLLSR